MGRNEQLFEHLAVNTRIMEEENGQAKDRDDTVLVWYRVCFYYAGVDLVPGSNATNSYSIRIEWNSACS